MKNILVITNIYPMPDSAYEGTKAIHYFTNEWVKMGYKVKVIHIKSYFPVIFHFLGKIFTNFIKAKTGSVVYAKRITKDSNYLIDNVPVLIIPAFKLFPHARFNRKRINKIIDTIVEDNEKDAFIPEIATAHFRNPQLQILFHLKEKYKNLKTSMVLHCNGSKLKKIYPENYKTYLKSIDILGFRSHAFKKGFEKIHGLNKSNFLCYSGIPDKYLNFRNRDFKTGVDNYCFVGSLYKLKRIDDTIKALYRAYPNKNFQFHIVGDGAEMVNLKKIAKKLNLENNIIFYGKLSRNKAQEIMYQSDYFVMVSYPEAFGLVYIEAMGKGCITIGTKNQGIDGVIINGHNGFLCEGNNINELSHIFTQIQNLDNISLQKISENAYETASKMTNYNSAVHYLNSIINL